MAAFQERHRRIIHTAFSILAKGLSPDQRVAEDVADRVPDSDKVAAASQPTIDRDGEIRPPTESAPSPEIQAYTPEPSVRVGQSGPAAARFFRGLPWAGRLSAVSVVESISPALSLEKATLAAAEDKKGENDFQTLASVALEEVEPPTTLSFARDSLAPQVSAARFFRTLPWVGLPDVDTAPAFSSRVIATPEPTVLETALETLQAAEIPPTLAVEEAETRSPVFLTVTASRFFRTLPWTGLAVVLPTSGQVVDLSSREAATLVSENLAEPQASLLARSPVDAPSQASLFFQHLPWRQESSFALDEEKPALPISATPDDPRHDNAAAFFKGLPWGASKPAAGQIVLPNLGIGLGGAMMAAATQSALMAATRINRASACPEANTYFKTLPWRGKPHREDKHPLP